MSFRNILFLVLALFHSISMASVSGYVPIHTNPLLEKYIDHLMLIADKTSLIKPLPVKNVSDAYKQVCLEETQYDFCQPVKNWLASRRNDSVSFDINIELKATNGQKTSSLANRKGVASNSNYIIEMNSFWQPIDFVAINVGGLIWDEGGSSKSSYEGNYISVGADWAQLDIGYKPHWLSPFKDSAMILSTNAPSMATLSLSNSSPIGPLNLKYEFFVGEQTESDRIFHVDGYVSGKPILTGVHLSIKPFPGLSLGVNRLLQSGGGERGGRSLTDFFAAFFDPNGADNTNDNLTKDEQFGNQTASFIARMDVQQNTPFSIYMEYAGEDTSDASSWRLGNSSLSIGIDIPNLFESYSFNVEWSDWQNAWYVHSVYQDGLTNDGILIGHWAAAERQYGNTLSGSGVGSSVINMSVGYISTTNEYYLLKYRQIDNQNYQGTDTYSTHHEISLDAFIQLYEQTLKVSLKHSVSVFDHSFSGLTIGVNF